MGFWNTPLAPHPGRPGQGRAQREAAGRSLAAGGRRAVELFISISGFYLLLASVGFFLI
jgi:hypothetical protein